LEKNRRNEKIAALLSKELAAPEREELLRASEQDPALGKSLRASEKVWELTGAYRSRPGRVDTAGAWAKLEQRLDTAAPPLTADTPVRPIGRRPRWLQIAAAVLVLALVVGRFLWPGATADRTMVVTAAGETQEVFLPDGSQIWLNENSQLAYAPGFVARDVELVGEAFFAVTPDPQRPFSIRTAETVVTVLGTSFNVRAYPEETRTEVAVATGKVAVAPKAAPAATAVELLPGEAAIYDRETAELRTDVTIAPAAQAWRTHELPFDDVPLRSVLPVLERYLDRPVRVENPALLDCTIRHTFKNPDFAAIKALLDFQLPGVDVSEAGDTIVLSGTSCSG
jgi:ferric-dicitrate binding protein FerR (iron transport regulator)